MRLTLTAGAETLRIAFARGIESRLGPGGDLRHVADWGSKLGGAVVRIAGLLHSTVCAEEGKPVAGVVTGEVMAAAIQIAEYLIPHMLAAVAEMGSDPDEDADRAAWDRIRGIGEYSFVERDLFNALRGRAYFKKMTAVKATLGRLAERRLIRQVPLEARVGRGQPRSPTWEVNPLALAPYAQNAHDPQKSPSDHNSADSADSAEPVGDPSPDGEGADDDDDAEILHARKVGA